MDMLSLSLLHDRNFTSPQTIRIESGIAQVMEQYDRNFKVQQLMGTDTRPMPAMSTKRR